MPGSDEALDAVLAHAGLGLALLDAELRFVRVNDALLAMSGRPASDYLGRTVEEVAPDRPDIAALVARVRATGERSTVLPVLDAVTAEGDPLLVEIAYFPVAGGGVGCVVRDVAAAVSRDRAVERLTQLQAITGALAMARTVDDVARVVLEDVRGALDADAAALCTRDGDDLEVVASVGYPHDVLARFGRVSLDADVPFSEACRTGRAVVAASPGEIARRWPGLGSELAPDRRALVALPLVVEGEPRGTLGFSFDHPLPPDDELQQFVEAIGTQCSQALWRAELHESEQTARDRLAFLADAGQALTASLDWETTMRGIAGLAVPRLADLAGVFVVDGRRLRALEVTHAHPDRQEQFRKLATSLPLLLDDAVGLGAVARAGEPLLVPEIPPGEGAFGLRSILAVPLQASDRCVGVVVLGTEGARTLGTDELALASELAVRAGQALVNADLFRDRAYVASTLQASLLPPAVAEVPGLDVATRFHAVGEGIRVGGDFYDVFPMGRPGTEATSWAVVIGDVRGKGVEAATVSGAARHALRSAALVHDSPSAMLGHLNDHLLVLAGGAEEPRFCTAAVIVVTPTGAGAELRVAVGGHPPPYVLRASGDTEPIEPEGPLLGVLAEPVIEETTLVLGTADALVLYTDGVTERHAGSRFFDEEGLAAVVSRCVGFTAAVLAERIETASRAFVEDAPRDDMAVVVLRVPERKASLSTTSTDLPADSTAPHRARRFVAAALDALGAGHDADVAALLASELATNAVLHGAPPLRVAVEAVDTGVRVTVTDGGDGLPDVRTAGPSDESGRGLLLVAALARRWGTSPPPGGAPGKAVWFELDR